jgi:COP9 signalosome complex subunit 4
MSTVARFGDDLCFFALPRAVTGTVALIQLQRSFATMDQKLAQLSVLNQKDKGTTYLALLSSIFSSQGNPNIANDVHALVDHLINQDAGIIASRQVLSELIKGLTSTNIPNKELRKAVVEDVLSVVQLRATSYEEQVRAI